jgi:hypothetical protein
MRGEAEKAGLTINGLEAFDKVQEGLLELLAKT